MTIMKKDLLTKFFMLNLLTAGLIIMGCTDLEIEESDSLIAESGAGFIGVEDVDGAIDNVYNGFNRLGDQANLYALQEVSSDGLLVPTRGTDWGDNGLWRTLHQHTWDATHPFLLTAWNNWNSSIFLASEIIDSRSGANASQLALASFARAFAMNIVLDNFAQVPFREPDEGPEIDPKVLSASEALDFILNDLDVAISGLPSVAAMDSDNLNRGTRASAQFLKAKVLLNAHIYSFSWPAI